MSFEELPKERSASSAEKTDRLLGKDPGSFNVEVRGGNLEINSLPLCESKSMQEALEATEPKITKLFENLPKGHPWREQKLEHQKMASREARKILAGVVGDKWPQENYELLSFLGQIHDLGRVTQALGKMPDGSHHGYESIKILEDWGIIGEKTKYFTEETQEVIRYVLIHHAEKETPGLPDNPTDIDQKKYLYACLFRDTDKLANLKDRTDIYLSEKGKKEQTGLHSQFLKGETGRIDPPEILEGFVSHSSINVKECRSYESYMLQHLAWIFDVTFKATLKEIIATGAIEKHLAYFKERLNEADYSRIEKATLSYLKERGFDLK